MNKLTKSVIREAAKAGEIIEHMLRVMREMKALYRSRRPDGDYDCALKGTLERRDDPQQRVHGSDHAVRREWGVKRWATTGSGGLAATGSGWYARYPVRSCRSAKTRDPHILDLDVAEKRQVAV